jgi:hypothetical protein
MIRKKLWGSSNGPHDLFNYRTESWLPPVRCSGGEESLGICGVRGGYIWLFIVMVWPRPRRTDYLLIWSGPVYTYTRDQKLSKLHLQLLGFANFLIFRSAVQQNSLAHVIPRRTRWINGRIKTAEQHNIFAGCHGIEFIELNIWMENPSVGLTTLKRQSSPFSNVGYPITPHCVDRAESHAKSSSYQSALRHWYKPKYLITYRQVPTYETSYLIHP